MEFKLHIFYTVSPVFYTGVVGGVQRHTVALYFYRRSSTSNKGKLREQYKDFVCQVEFNELTKFKQ
jgi:hypothetical protein